MAAPRLTCALATHPKSVAASRTRPWHQRPQEKAFIHAFLVPTILCGKKQHGTTRVYAVGNKTISVTDSLDILELDSAAATDAEELKKAYYKRMREIHPDVNPEQDTTESAALVNAAYAALLKVCAKISDQASIFINQQRHILHCLQEVGDSPSGVVVTGDACDRCDGPLSTFFVNPFALGTDPFLWRELHEAVCQALARITDVGSSADGDSSYEEVNELQMEEALQVVGLRAVPGSVVWLTVNQRYVVEELMVELEESMSFEVVEWMLVDSLQRAEKANRRAWNS